MGLSKHIYAQTWAMAIDNPFKRHRIPFPTRNYYQVKFFPLSIPLLIASLNLSGCVTMADPEASQDYTSDAVVIIDNQTNLGQSFISRRPNLNGITFWISSPPAQANTTSTSQNINI